MKEDVNVIYSFVMVVMKVSFRCCLPYSISSERDILFCIGIVRKGEVFVTKKHIFIDSAQDLRGRSLVLRAFMVSIFMLNTWQLGLYSGILHECDQEEALGVLVNIKYNFKFFRKDIEGKAIGELSMQHVIQVL
jgi:hypothetical protein